MKFRISLTGRRKAIVLATTSALVAAGLVGVATNTAYAQSGCSVTYAKQWDNGGGFGANVTITNHGAAINGWTLTWTWAGNQQVGNGWLARWSQSGQNVTAQNETWNAAIPTGGSITPGFNGSYTGTNTNPTVFQLNGVQCSGPQQSSPPQSSPPQSSPPQSSPPPQPGQRVPNPYAGADGYVNPDWQEAAQVGGAPASVYNQPTAVWLDRIEAIDSGSAGSNTMGLADHLDEAVAQDAANGGDPVVIQVVVYNLPGRDCAALASNGQLGPTEIGRYQTEFIDPIAEIMSRPEYANLRIVGIIEIDSLPNLITNVGGRPTATPECDVMLANGNYVNGVAYALGTLGAIGNVYNYVDIGHHGWLGWSDNFQPFANLMGQVVRTAPSGPEDLHGFVSNVANYGVLDELYFSITDNVGGRNIREVPLTEGGWIDFNNYLDELEYVRAYQPVLSSAVGHNVSMLIDTSRNGWGGPDRPTGTSTSTNPVTYMDESRIDRRIHIGNWCNQSGAGLGARPQASPTSGVDAYVWVKPPGESDGSSEFIENDEGKGFDRMCDPTFLEGTPRNGNSPSGALPGAPLSGHWFQAQFEELIANAFPPA